MNNPDKKSLTVKILHSTSVPSPTEQISSVGFEGPPEFGGRRGLEPVRYGDWEKDGKCVDF